MITFPNSNDLREVVKNIPLESFALEQMRHFLRHKIGAGNV